MPLPSAAQRARLRTLVERHMETPVTLVTKTVTLDRGGETEVFTDGATVLGRVSRREVPQLLAGLGAGGDGALVIETVETLQVPLAVTLSEKDAVLINGFYYEITKDSSRSDPQALAHTYQIARLGSAP